MIWSAAERDANDATFDGAARGWLEAHDAGRDVYPFERVITEYDDRDSTQGQRDLAQRFIALAEVENQCCDRVKCVTSKRHAIAMTRAAEAVDADVRREIAEEIRAMLRLGK